MLFFIWVSNETKEKNYTAFSCCDTDYFTVVLNPYETYSYHTNVLINVIISSLVSICHFSWFWLWVFSLNVIRLYMSKLESKSLNLYWVLSGCVSWLSWIHVTDYCRRKNTPSPLPQIGSIQSQINLWIIFCDKYEPIAHFIAVWGQNLK